MSWWKWAILGYLAAVAMLLWLLQRARRWLQ